MVIININTATATASAFGIYSHQLHIHDFQNHTDIRESIERVILSDKSGNQLTATLLETSRVYVYKNTHVENV